MNHKEILKLIFIKQKVKKKNLKFKSRISVFLYSGERAQRRNYNNFFSKRVILKWKRIFRM